MKIDAKQVKALRDETDAPMMECKKALVEAEGDIEKAKQLLREKGQAQAAKREGRATSEGLAMVVASEDGTKVAGIIVECETDFVARNDDFKTMVGSLVEGLLSAISPGDGESVCADGSTEIEGKSLSSHMEDAVAKIRENIRVATATVSKAKAGAKFAVYNHANTGKAASYVQYSGDNADAAFQIAVHTAWGKPTFLKRDDVPQDMVQKEIEIETQRAINDGKPAELAAKIATGRVNKEYYQSQVLSEQPFYTDSKTKTGDYAKQNGIEVLGYAMFEVGAGASEEQA